MGSSNRGFYPNAPFFQDGGYKTRRIIKYLSKETKKLVIILIFCNQIIQSRLNRGCLVYVFSLRFSGSKFLMNLRRQFRVCKIFSCTLNFLYTSFCGICSLFIFLFKITILIVRDLLSRLLFH